MGDPTCAEHCYACILNPMQHPRVDANIHHLLALVTALCRTCGGVIFLQASEGISQNEINFARFDKRLREMLAAFKFPEGLVETSKCDTVFWGIIVAKTYRQRLPYYIGGKAISVEIDMHGQLQYENMPVETSSNTENISTHYRLPWRFNKVHVTPCSRPGGQ